MTKPKNRAAVALGKLGARKGGKARWAKMTEAEREAHIARMVKARKPKRHTWIAKPLTD